MIITLCSVNTNVSVNFICEKSPLFELFVLYTNKKKMQYKVTVCECVHLRLRLACVIICVHVSAYFYIKLSIYIYTNAVCLLFILLIPLFNSYYSRHKIKGLLTAKKDDRI